MRQRVTRRQRSAATATRAINPRQIGKTTLAASPLSSIQTAKQARPRQDGTDQAVNLA